MTENKHFDAVVIGGGMVGLTMGIALGREGLNVGVVEPSDFSVQTAPQFDGRVSAIAYGSYRMLERLGIWQYVSDLAEPILDIRVSDADSPFFLDYDHEEVGTEPFGWIVENRHLRIAMQKACADCKTLNIISPAKAISVNYSSNTATMKLASGDTLHTQLVIAADGKQSPTRKAAGIGVLSRNYKQTALVCTIAHSEPHNGLAQERFLPVGPFAVLPMREQRSSLVWVEPDDRVAVYTQLPPSELEQEIAERVGGYLGDIQFVAPLFTYPLQLVIAKQYTANRMALIGDAAHTIHPIAGQGVNLGFRDVAVLHEIIHKQKSLGLDIGSVSALEAYERWRSVDTLSMAAVTDGINRMFSNSILPVKVARGMGLWAVGKMPPLKRLFMRHAMGIIGDIPLLMKNPSS